MASVQQLQTLLSGRQYTNPNKSIYEEPPAAPPPILSTQIRSSAVPTSAPFGTPEKAPLNAVYPTTGVSILQLVKNSPMVPANSITALSFNHSALRTAIQDSYGDGTYRPYVTNNTGTRIIPLGSNGMFINYSGGNITFKTPMPDVSNTLPPRISLYNYIGSAVTPAAQHTVTLTNTTSANVSSIITGTIEITIQSAIPDAPAATIILSRANPAANPRYNITMATRGGDGSAVAFVWPPNACISANKTSNLYNGSYTVCTSFGA
jgi:hypothetical protein